MSHWGRHHETTEPGDPHEVLGLDRDASEAEIRAAYLRLIRQHPPDSDPEMFERVRDAHDLLRDPTRRVARLLQAGDPLQPLEELVGERRERLHVGPKPWLAAIGGR